MAKAALFRELWRALPRQILVQGSQREFIAAKLAEREQPGLAAGGRVPLSEVEPEHQGRQRGTARSSTCSIGSRPLPLYPGKMGRPRTRSLRRTRFRPTSITAKPSTGADTLSPALSYGQCRRNGLSFECPARDGRAAFVTMTARGFWAVERFMKHYFLNRKGCRRPHAHSLFKSRTEAAQDSADFESISTAWTARSSRAKLAATTAFRFDNGRLNVKPARCLPKRIR